MGFDWFIFFAQVVNFLILVALLKRLLYGRIVEAMDARERAIQQRLEEAAEKAAQAQQEKEAYLRKQENMDLQKDALFAEAKREALQERRQLLEAAESETQEKRRRWHEALAHEKAAFVGILRKHALRHVYRVIEKTFAELGDSTAQTPMLRVFFRRLRGLSEQERTEFLEDVSGTNVAVLVRSAFPIEATLKAELKRVLQEVFETPLEVSFAHTPELICGVELASQGHTIAWNVDDYLERLEQDVGQAVELQAHGVRLEGGRHAPEVNI